MIKYPVIVVPFLKVSGMAIFPFILVNHKSLTSNVALIRHETIHLKQEAELLVIPFYLFYLAHYCINLVKYRNHNRAYEQICFEREAYANEYNYNYLAKRPLWAWWRYIN